MRTRLVLALLASSFLIASASPAHAANQRTESSTYVPSAVLLTCVSWEHYYQGGAGGGCFKVYSGETDVEIALDGGFGLPDGGFSYAFYDSRGYLLGSRRWACGSASDSIPSEAKELNVYVESLSIGCRPAPFGTINVTFSKSS